MPARIIEIADLQPIDFLRVQSVLYLETLDIRNLTPPQVWHTQEGMLVSDSNNSLALLARSREKQVEVDYNDARSIREGDDLFIDTINELARQMKKKGVYSPSDLWQA